MSLLRQLPSVDAVLNDPRVAVLPRGIALAAARAALEALREEIRSGTRTDVPEVAPLVVERVRRLLAPSLGPVLNATGVVLHTNLGRAPWAREAMEGAMRAADYCGLEMDLESGTRGGRTEALEALVCHVTGAEAALVVNNGAAGVLLSLTALARDREVVVSRGEMVEIGGGFRVPEVIASGGARLREVGTTNRTRLSDFEAAQSEQTAVFLRVHRSNFRMVGFTEDVPRDALVALAHGNGLLVVEDVGSGSLEGELGEPSVREAVAAGVDLVVFSGDKLLGGPQAGIIAGRADAVERLRKHPLYRALRVDKVTIAALEATFAIHARGEATPVDRMLRASQESLAEAADKLLALLRERNVPAHRDQDVGAIGGGSAPGVELPSEIVVIDGERPRDLAQALRRGEPPIVARVHDEGLRLDVRTLRLEDLPLVADGVALAFRRGY